MDKFPEAFERFETEVDTDKIRSFSELKASFRIWSGQHWKNSYKQVEALKREAERLNRSRDRLHKIRFEPERPQPRRAYRSKGAYKRERLRRHYTVIKVRGKIRIVARIPKGKAGAGRFAKAWT